MAAAASQASELLKALGNPHRLMLLCQMIERERTVSELAAAYPAAETVQPAAVDDAVVPADATHEEGATGASANQAYERPVP